MNRTLYPGGNPDAPAPPQPTTLRAMPVWPLAATLAVQTLATMALFSLPAAAPAVARDLHVPGTLIGTFVALVYTVGIVSALGSPGFIHRHGAVRVSQVVLLSVMAMLLVCATGTIAGLAVGAVLLGLSYGANAPAATHLLVPQTPPRVFNMVMSLRQIGVPLGGVLGSLIVPPITVLAGWRVALLVEVVPALLLCLALQRPRERWDAARDPRRRLPGLRGFLAPFRLLREDPRLIPLSVASFLYSGIQLCFMAFMTVHLTTVAGFDLISAGRALAAYQLSGAISRPIWGWAADRFLTPNRTLIVQGFIMAAAALTAGQFGRHWPVLLVVAVATIAGASAGGYTGIAYAQYARLGGMRRTEATGLGTALMFFGVTVIPSGFGLAVGVLGNYADAYAALGVLSLLGTLPLCLPIRWLPTRPAA
ncbi:MAG TPA: MFS transporter [Acetobacteraceae bacterium]|nr:MFS transporter [Acetobacteraceae bacterium]